MKLAKTVKVKVIEKYKWSKRECNSKTQEFDKSSRTKPNHIIFTDENSKTHSPGEVLDHMVWKERSQN